MPRPTAQSSSFSYSSQSYTPNIHGQESTAMSSSSSSQQQQREQRIRRRSSAQSISSIASQHSSNGFGSDFIDENNEQEDDDSADPGGRGLNFAIPPTTMMGIVVPTITLRKPSVQGVSGGGFFSELGRWAGGGSPSVDNGGGLQQQQQQQQIQIHNYADDLETTPTQPLLPAFENQPRYPQDDDDHNRYDLPPIQINGPGTLSLERLPSHSSSNSSNDSFFPPQDILSPPLTPLETPPKPNTQSQGTRRYAYAQQETPDRKVNNRPYRDRTPSPSGQQRPILSSLTSDGSPVRSYRGSQMGSSSEDHEDDLPYSRQGSPSPTKRKGGAGGAAGGLGTAAKWFSNFTSGESSSTRSATKILSTNNLKRSRSPRQDYARRQSIKQGKYMGKDDHSTSYRGSINHQRTVTRTRRNAFFLIGIAFVGFIIVMNMPRDGGEMTVADVVPKINLSNMGGKIVSKLPSLARKSKGKSATNAPGLTVPKVRNQARGKTEKEIAARAAEDLEEEKHLLDGLPENILSFPLHPMDPLDGTLIVDPTLPAEAHPIYQLIKEGREKWHNKVKRQSRTLKQAVIEYRRRNRGMNPPKGFDKWWQFVVENDIPLPDEYDQINRDLHLFRALSPRELNERIDRASQLDDTFMISVHSGSVRTRSTYSHEIGGADDRVAGQVDLLQDFEIQDWLPDFRAVYGIHDTPQGLIEWSHRRDLIERIEDDEYYTDEEELDFMKRGLIHVCPPSSLMGQSGEIYQDPTNKESKTFIADPLRTFDLCNHPTYFPIHGVTSEKIPHMDKELKAVFSLSKTALHTDILGVPVEQYIDELPYIPWEDRTNNKLLWRGSNTGTFASMDTNWRLTHRPRLVEETSPEYQGKIDLLPVPGGIHKSTIADSTIRANKGTVNAVTMDVSFAGEPLQCQEDDGTCDDLRREYHFSQVHMTHDEALNFKYILDVDGNSWSARTRRLFAGGSLLFKSTIMPEWWTERAQAWVHYVPINIDYSDLHDSLLFFRGDTYARGGEDELAEEIAEAGEEWARTSWRRVDMAAYVARLYLEWARLTAPTRGGSDFVYHPSMEMVRE